MEHLLALAFRQRIDKPLAPRPPTLPVFTGARTLRARPPVGIAMLRATRVYMCA